MLDAPPNDEAVGVLVGDGVVVATAVGVGVVVVVSDSVGVGGVLVGVSDAVSAVALCRCGHSQRKPFCDGSHKKTRDEEEGKVYEYDDEGHRREIG